MVKIPKMSCFLRDNCCETCHNIPQKNQEELFNKRDFGRFRNVCSNVLKTKELFDEVAVGSRFVLFKVKVLIYL